MGKIVGLGAAALGGLTGAMKDGVGGGLTIGSMFGLKGASVGAIASGLGYYPGRGLAAMTLSKEDQKERQKNKKKELSKRKK